MTFAKFNPCNPCCKPTTPPVVPPTICCPTEKTLYLTYTSCDCQCLADKYVGITAQLFKTLINCGPGLACSQWGIWGWPLVINSGNDYATCNLTNDTPKNMFLSFDMRSVCDGDLMNLSLGVTYFGGPGLWGNYPFNQIWCTNGVQTIYDFTCNPFYLSFNIQMSITFDPCVCETIGNSITVSGEVTE